MTAAPNDVHDGVPHKSPWVRRLAAEIIRGRHVIVHGNVHDVALWNHRFVPVPQVLQEVLEAIGFELIGRYDQLDGLSFASPDGNRRFTDLLNGPAAPPADSPGTDCAADIPPAGGAPDPVDDGPDREAELAGPAPPAGR